MVIEGITTWNLLAMVLAFIGAGVVRGFNGGAGANFITAPVLAILIGPQEGVPVITLLNLISNVQVLPSAIPHTNWRKMLPICLGATVTAPFGAWLLLVIDQETMRRAVAVTSVVLALVLLAGWRYRGPRDGITRTGVGGIAGLITGSVSMGGPPVFLYLLSGTGNAYQQRANFLTFSFFVQSAALVSFLIGGLLTDRTLIICSLLCIPFFLATWAGIRLFSRASDAQFRNYTLWGIATLSFVIALF